MADPVLDALLAEAADDPGTLGLLLTGSRAAGLEDESSDYDAYDAYLNAFVRSTRAHERGDELGARVHAAESVAFLARALAHREWGHAHAKQGS